MNFFNKLLIFILIIFVCASIYKDVTTGSIPTTNNTNKPVSDITTTKGKSVQVQVLPGQTVLSIVENYTKGKTLDVKQIITEFKKLNPHVKPYQLEAYKYYYFPIINDGQPSEKNKGE